MTTQSLFEDRPPYVRGSATSEAAADAILSQVPILRAQVLAFIRGRGAQGATDEECQQLGGFPANTQRPRRVELARAGRIVPSGTRKTAAGRSASVWVAAERTTT